MALAVSGRAGKWRARWGLCGTYDDPAFVRALRARVWRRPLWAPPVGSGADQEMAVCGVDLSFHTNSTRVARPQEIRAALRTQVTGRLVQSAGPVAICGLDMRGSGGERHFAGAAAPEKLIAFSYRMWRREIGIINPHIGSNAAALANLYLAFYPADHRAAEPWRMLVLVGRETIHALLLNDWRLVDAITFQLMENQIVNDTLLDSWVHFFKDSHSLESPVVPCVIESPDSHARAATCEYWSPFDHAPVAMDASVRELVSTHPDLASLAFGMALQGG